MCEVAIVDPQEKSAVQTTEVARTVYNSMGDSLGLVAVYDEGGELRFGTHKAVEPNWEEVDAFVRAAKNQGAFLMIAHGRLATAGAVTQEHAHPLEIDCPECDVDYVVHNGVLGRHRAHREQHEQLGHEYNTEVDSEMIAHDFREVPTDIEEDDLDLHGRQPSFILMNEDAVFISGNRYNLADDGTMSLHYRDFGPDHTDDLCDRLIITPAEETE